MKRKYIITTLLITSVLIFVLTFQTTLDQILTNYSSPRLANSSIYGKGCPENLFHARMVKLLNTWIAIAGRRNITYFVCYGSLLGLYRDGDVIPYDNDIDVCIFRRDLYKLEKEDETKPFEPNDGKTHLVYQKHCHHLRGNAKRTTCKGVEVTRAVDQCTFLDPCARLFLRPPTSGRTTWMDVFAMRDNGTFLLDDWKWKRHRRDIIFPLRPCVFMGIQTICPNKITAYLRRYYGKDFATNSHYICKDGEWVATGKDAKIISLPRCPQYSILCHAKFLIQGIGTQ